MRSAIIIARSEGKVFSDLDTMGLQILERQDGYIRLVVYERTPKGEFKILIDWQTIADDPVEKTAVHVLANTLREVYKIKRYDSNGPLSPI